MRIRKMGCDLLIGTPGRLKDILSDPMSGVKTSNLSSLVLDEADRLLDQGFAPEIMEIQSLLPSPNKVDRQTLMFSATVPKEVLHVVRGTMKPNFQFVKTVRDDEVPTHLSVPQKLVMLKGLENGLPAVLEIAQKYKDQEKQNPSLRPFKAIVYYNTTSEVTLAYEACLNLRRFTDLGRSMGDTRFHYIHSRLTQGRRTLNADSFRKARSGVLLSSDVTARGMDFPDVTHVIQVGLPRGRDSYIHRVGRTARANKTGEAWCLMHRKQYDAFLDFVGDLPVERDNSLVSANANMSSLASCTPEEMKFVDPVNMAMAEASPTAKREAYMSQVNGAGYRSKRDMIQTLNAFATVGMKLPEPPSISPMLASKLGLDRTPGVNIGARVPYMEMVGGERGMSRGGFNDRGRGMSRGRFDGGDRRSSRGGFDRPSFADRRGDSFDDRFSGKPRLSNDRNDPRRRRGSLF